jgi:DNA-binding beta-propeller fold protein YncE
VADTNGGALLVYQLGSRSLHLVATIAVGSRPYGIAADPASGWVYVTVTGTNQLVALHLSGGTVTARMTWPTGRQPNSVAYDAAIHDIVVADTGSNQLEFIPAPPGS